MSEERFKEVFRRITAETPDAPAFSDLETHRARPAVPIRFKPWMAALGAAALVLVIVGAFGLLGGGGPDLAAPDEDTIDYVKLEYSATVNPVCEGGEIIDNGGFDEATIEIWGPNSDDLTLMVATFPDGSSERTVVEGDPFDPGRAWGIDPATFEEETGFRSVRCSNPPDWAIFAQPLLIPPYQPGYTPHSYLLLPPGYETWDEFLDYDKSLSELNGNSVTVHSQTESLTAGEYHIEFYVSLDDPDQLLGQLYEYDLPAQGALTMQMTVVDLKQVATDSVSFSTAGLFLISRPGGEFLEEGEIPADCHVTIPSQAFTPPGSHPEAPSGSDTVWFGRDELWTVLSTDGISAGRKSVWWSAEFTDPRTESSPEIIVTYTLLNGSSPLTIVNDQGTNASTPEDGLFIIAGVEPDVQGCWQVTAIYKNVSLSYVYYNPEGEDPAAVTLTAVVPEVVGMTVDNAMRAITGKGFKPFFVDSDDPLYEVCAQDPAAGSVVDVGGAVEMRTAPLGGCGDLLGLTDPNSCDRAPEFIEGPAVYFNCSDGTDSEPRPVPRDFATGLPTETAVEQVFAEMLLGPTTAEREASYWSSFSEETADALLYVAYDNEVQGLVLDFTEAILVNNASTSTGSEFFLGELLANVFQFEEVRSVEFRVNGSCEAFWYFLQAGPDVCNVIDRP